jgi:aminocarboxymuconate-semialdehyde decarboxylase
MRVVDVHEHVIPPALVERIRQGTAPDGIRLDTAGPVPIVVHRQGYRYPLAESFHDVQARLKSMDELGIDVAVLSIAPPFLLYDIDPAEAVQSARLVNDSLAEMVSQGSDRFSAVATLPMQDPAAAAEELRRAAGELNLRGAQIGTHIDGVPLDAEAMAPVLREAQELGVPLILHPYYVGSTPGLDDFYLTNLEGNPWQTALAASRLILSGSLDRLPDLDLLLVHGGGHLLFQIGRLDHGHTVRSDAGSALKLPSDYLRRFHYDTLTHRADSTAWLVDQVGADRVAFGTDIPFDMAGGSFAAQVGDASRYPDGALDWVAHVTAERLFSLEGGSR